MSDFTYRDPAFDWAGIVAFFAVGGTLMSFAEQSHVPALSFFAACGAIAARFGVGFAAHKLRETRIVRPAIEKADRLPLPEAIEYLTGILWKSNGENGRLAGGVLKRLLPTLTPATFGLITDAGKASFHKAMKFAVIVEGYGEWYYLDDAAPPGVHHWYDAELGAALFAAAAAVGDSEAIPIAEQFALRIGASLHPEVAATAQTCLDTLKDLTARERDRATLLRQASSTETATLLREVAGAPEQSLELGRTSQMPEADSGERR